MSHLQTRSGFHRGEVERGKFSFAIIDKILVKLFAESSQLFGMFGWFQSLSIRANYGDAEKIKGFPVL